MKNIIVTSYKIKEDILLNNNGIHDYVFIDKRNLINKLTYSYDNKALYYLMEKYSINYSLARIYLNNINYIDINKDYKSNKLNKLKEIKKDLIENNVILKDELFIDNISNRKITFINCYLNKFEKTLLSNYELEYNYDDKKTEKVYEFDTVKQEVEFVASRINKLVSDGVNINDIKIVNFSDEYTNEIRRVFKYHNININFDSSLYGNKKTIEFIRNLKKTSNVLESLDSIKDSKVYVDILHICDQYSDLEYNEIVFNLILNDIKNKKVNHLKYKNSVDVINIEDIKKDEHVFWLSFNDTIYPKIFMDDDYLSDKDKEELGIDTSFDLNELEEYKIKNILLNNDIVLSYKLNGNKEYNKSRLVDILGLEIVKEDYDYKYSNNYNKLMLSSMIDDLVKYNKEDNNLKVLNNSYNIDYKMYDNSFTNININSFYEYLNNKLSLSYSALDNYYKCGFRYYLNNILRVTKIEPNFSTIIGTIIHYFLEDNNDINTFEEYISTLELTKKEYKILSNLKEEINFIIDNVNSMDKLSKLDNVLYEYKSSIDISNKLNVVFKGFIDKLKYNDESLSIIDYKTGYVEIDKDKVKYGLNMQLPMYLYLVKNDPKFKDYNVLGFYLQKVLNNDLPFNIKKDYVEEKKKLLKLNGYTISDENLLNDLDITYRDSELIKGLKQKKDGGFYFTSKLISNEEIEDLVSEVDSKVKEARDKIENAEFTINPKRLENKLIGCKFCEFKDICFMKEEDIVDLDGDTNVD